MKKLRLTNPREIRHALTRVANYVLNGELDPKRANTIIACCNVILSAIRTDDVQKQLDEVNKLLEDHKIF